MTTNRENIVRLEKLLLAQIASWENYFVLSSSSSTARTISNIIYLFEISVRVYTAICARVCARACARCFHKFFAFKDKKQFYAKWLLSYFVLFQKLCHRIYAVIYVRVYNAPFRSLCKILAFLHSVVHWSHYIVCQFSFCIVSHILSIACISCGVDLENFCCNAHALKLTNRKIPGIGIFTKYRQIPCIHYACFECWGKKRRRTSEFEAESAMFHTLCLSLSNSYTIEIIIIITWRLEITACTDCLTIPISRICTHVSPDCTSRAQLKYTDLIQFSGSW